MGGLVSPARAGPPTPAALAEIAHLMQVIRASDCQFNRNGAWHSTPDAHQHIDQKLQYLRSAEKITSAESFIELAAAQSSTTGKLYMVQCPGRPLQPARAWLMLELTRYRASVGTRPP